MADALKVAINVMEISRYRQEESSKHSIDTILKTVCGEAPSQGGEGGDGWKQHHLAIFQLS